MTASQELQDSFDESLKLSSQGQTSCTLKRQLRSHSTATRSFPAKRLCGGALSNAVVEETDMFLAEANLLTKPSGFLTAGSSREIGVSEKALSLARARFRSPVDATEDGSVKRDVPSTFPGFVTAGSNKIITVTEAALEAARRRLNSIEDVEESNINRGKTDEENLDPTVHSSSVGDSSLKRFISVLVTPQNAIYELNP
ncbi:BRCA2 repeat protein [Oesophagostomum dentatum]|uniref:BRCA2 repeat protein n=1 Tax=Oesophagostomum dentatum TaxID=61180 RepID=A0A0B1T6S4_OESDE|nr:BRCA2 repeat protein [Oesophagostomum dentatum]